MRLLESTRRGSYKGWPVSKPRIRKLGEIWFIWWPPQLGGGMSFAFTLRHAMQLIRLHDGTPTYFARVREGLA